jgi:hypothetical protein
MGEGKNQPPLFLLIDGRVTRVVIRSRRGFWSMMGIS